MVQRCEANRKSNREYAKKHREEYKTYTNNWRARHPDAQIEQKQKHRLEVTARRKVRYIRMKDSCEICGKFENLEKYHPDYSKPLEIQTLCTTCHGTTHRKSECETWRINKK